MASKLNFRARNLDVAKPMVVYRLEDLPELADLNAINRSVPAMPSGMEKEEEAEKHLQDILESQEHSVALVSGGQKKGSSAAGSPKKAPSELTIPTPKVFVTDDFEAICPDLYKRTYKPPKQYIHVQPFTVDRDQPEYDLDDEDSEFLEKKLIEEKKLEVDALTLEDMLDRLEKNSGHSVVSANEAKMLLKQDDDLIFAVYDYWMDKRLRLRQPLIPKVKSDKRESLAASNSASAQSSSSSSAPATSDPYVAFRRRTEKMQTRKNRKNDEVSYEKMLKLRRDINRAVFLLELVRKREKTKKEVLHLTTDIFERRFACGDWEGRVVSEALAQMRLPQRVLQPAFTNDGGWTAGQQENAKQQKRSYKKKRKTPAASSQQKEVQATPLSRKKFNGPELGTISSDEEHPTVASPVSELEENQEGPYAFKRKRNCQYLAPMVDEFGFETEGGWPWETPEDGGVGEPRFRHSLASLSTPRPRCIGMVRRRMGRGGRIVLDRASTDFDQLWKDLDFTVLNGVNRPFPAATGQEDDEAVEEETLEDLPHFRPVTPPHQKEDWESSPVCKVSAPAAVTVGLPTQPLKSALHAVASATGRLGAKANSAIGPSLAAMLMQ